MHVTLAVRFSSNIINNNEIVVCVNQLFIFQVGTYFNFIMGMVASSVVLTVIVLNYHHRFSIILEFFDSKAYSQPNMQNGSNKKIFSRTPETHDMPTWVNILTSSDFGQQNCSAQNKFNMYILNNMLSYQEQLRCTRQVRNKDNWNKNPSNTSKISFFWSYAQGQKKKCKFHKCYAHFILNPISFTQTL